MKGIHNTKGAKLYLTFLTDDHCDSTDPYEYHLQVNNTKRIYGISNAAYEPFKDWISASKEYVCISTSDSQNSKLDQY